MAYEFVGRRPDIPESDAGWTQIMGVFLGRLARKEGYVQAWEVERLPGSRGTGVGAIDLGWYSDHGRRPVVAIEHESWLPGGESIASRRAAYLKIVPKLGAAPAEIRVLLTYVKGEQVQDRIVNELSGLFAGMKPTGEWVLGIGPYRSTKSEGWHGFVMSNGTALVRVD